VDFLALPDFDYSRTRLIDTGMGYEWDRIITYIKDPGLFVVFDVFKSRREEYFTLSNLWHTRKILSQGEHWYDTVYDRIQKNVLPTEKKLLIVFPSPRYRLEGVEDERRHYQDEKVIHRTAAQHFELGETAAFATVLVPHPDDEPPAEWAERIRMLPVSPEKNGLGVIIQAGGREIFVAAKQDLRKDMIRDWRRPRYTYESGRMEYGDFETNGDFLFAIKDGKSLSYTAVNLTKILHKGRILHEAKPSFFGLAFDASPDQPGTGKLRYWRDKVKLTRKNN
jgi:hypothetical protein